MPPAEVYVVQKALVRYLKAKGDAMKGGKT